MLKVTVDKENVYIEASGAIKPLLAEIGTAVHTLADQITQPMDTAAAKTETLELMRSVINFAIDDVKENVLHETKDR